MRQLFPTCESPIEITLTRNVVGLAPPDDDADDDERFDDVPLIAMRARMQQTEFGTELGHIVAHVHTHSVARVGVHQPTPAPPTPNGKLHHRTPLNGYKPETLDLET